MAVRSIVITGDPVLHTPAAPVTEFDSELATLIADMVDTMREAPGVGLAAPQLGIPLRVFVFDWTDDDDHRWSGVAVNPELWLSPTPAGPADHDRESEGCLSIPGERFPLRRADRAILKAQDAEGTPFEIEAEGWLARIFQHEYDHLDGVLYADRLDEPHRSDAAKIVRKARWGVPGITWMPGVDDLEG